MKYAAITILFILMQASAPVPREAIQGHRADTHSNKNATAPNKPPTSIPAKKADDASNNTHTKTPTSESANIPVTVAPVTVNKGRSDYVYIGATLIIALATLVLAIVAWTQAKAAKAGADAAKAQIEAIIAENRPWLLLDSIKEPYLVPAVEVPPEDQKFTYCITMTKNHGKTPAKIITYWAHLQIGESPVKPPIDLVVEIGRTAPIPEPFIFPPGEEKKAQATLCSGFISPQERDNVLKSPKVKFLWLLGFIKYRNTFEREPNTEYETRFCYLYETRTNSPQPFWTPAGPAEYNRAT